MLIGTAVAVAVITAGYGQSATPASAAVGTKQAADVALRAPQARPVLGIDVESDVNYSVSTAKAYGSRLAGYIHGTLHATSLSLVWMLCDPSFTSNIVGKCQRTLSSPAVKAIAEEARQDGLAVQLRPLIRVGPPADWGNPHLSWEGFIDPTNQLAWFRSLLAAETPYLKSLRGISGSQFVVATEPWDIADSPHWLWLLGKAHEICGCATSIASQTARYRAGVLPSKNTPGVDFYPHLNIPASASQQTVTARWEASTNMVPLWVRARTTLDEEGIRATVGAYQHPEDWSIGGADDPQVQARWFTAACQTVVRFHMRGVYFYNIPLNDDPAHPFNFPAYFVGNAGSDAIQGCAKLFSSVSSHVTRRT
jgi:hypothetical protein